MKCEATCPRCDLQSGQMKIILWEMGELYSEIVLWDGRNTYWNEPMIPSTGYEIIDFDLVNPVTGGRFTYIGEL